MSLKPLHTDSIKKSTSLNAPLRERHQKSLRAHHSKELAKSFVKKEAGFLLSGMTIMQNYIYEHTVVPINSAYKKLHNNSSLLRGASASVYRLYRVYDNNIYRPFTNFAERTVFGDLGDEKKWNEEKLTRRVRGFNRMSILLAVGAEVMGITGFLFANPLLLGLSAAFAASAVTCHKLTDRFGSVLRRRDDQHHITSVLSAEGAGLEYAVLMSISKDLVKRFNLTEADASKKLNPKKVEEILEYIEKNVKSCKTDDLALNEVLKKIDSLHLVNPKALLNQMLVDVKSSLSQFERAEKRGARGALAFGIGTALAGLVTFIASVAFGVHLPLAFELMIPVMATASLTSALAVETCNAERRVLHDLIENLEVLAECLESKSVEPEVSLENGKLRGVSKGRAVEDSLVKSPPEQAAVITEKIVLPQAGAPNFVERYAQKKGSVVVESLSTKNTQGFANKYLQQKEQSVNGAVLG